MTTIIDELEGVASDLQSSGWARAPACVATLKRVMGVLAARSSAPELEAAVERVMQLAEFTREVGKLHEHSSPQLSAEHIASAEKYELVLHALAEANERASLLRATVLTSRAERDEARLISAWSRSFGEAHDAMQDALKAIAYHADNQDIGHVDFRMKAKGQAEFTLEQCAGDAGALDGPPLPKPDWPDMASLKEALAASEARRGELEAERDEAIKDRDAQAQHVLKVASEAQDGFAALEEIDACWDQYGHRNNRAHLTLSEQIASTLRELEDMSENYGNAEGELKLAEERIAEFEAAALNPQQEGSRDHG